MFGAREGKKKFDGVRAAASFASLSNQSHRPQRTRKPGGAQDVRDRRGQWPVSTPRPRGGFGSLWGPGVCAFISQNEHVYQIELNLHHTLVLVARPSRRTPPPPSTTPPLTRHVPLQTRIYIFNIYIWISAIIITITISIIAGRTYVRVSKKHVWQQRVVVENPLVSTGLERFFSKFNYYFFYIRVHGTFFSLNFTYFEFILSNQFLFTI